MARWHKVTKRESQQRIDKKQLMKPPKNTCGPSCEFLFQIKKVNLRANATLL